MEAEEWPGLQYTRMQLFAGHAKPLVGDEVEEWFDALADYDFADLVAGLRLWARGQAGAKGRDADWPPGIAGWREAADAAYRARKNTGATAPRKEEPRHTAKPGFFGELADVTFRWIPERNAELRARGEPDLTTEEITAEFKRRCA